jgi:hypothetical protein
LQNLAQYSMVNNAAAAAGGTVQSPMSPLRSSPHHGSLVSPADACASTHVLYTVAQRSPQDSSLMSPGATGDLSPRSVSAHLSPGGAVSPQWFSQSSSPPSPSSRQRDAVAASGELSPAHASALQQRFQQFNMVSVSILVSFVFFYAPWFCRTSRDTS